MSEDEKTFSLGVKFKVQGQKEPKSDTITMSNTEDRNAFYKLGFVASSPSHSVDLGRSVIQTYYVYVSYGKIGSSGRTERKVFKDESSARRFISTKMKEKLKKGYKII